MTARRRWGSLAGVQVWSPAAVLLMVSVGFSILTDRFADLDNLRNVLLQASPIMVGATGMTLIVAARGIDLSIGADCQPVAGTGTGSGPGGNPFQYRIGHAYHVAGVSARAAAGFAVRWAQRRRDQRFTACSFCSIIAGISKL
jgi:hypothetical protein